MTLADLLLQYHMIFSIKNVPIGYAIGSHVSKRDGDGIAVFVEENPAFWIISDDGDTVATLIASGIDEDRIHQIIDEHGARLVNGDLRFEIGPVGPESHTRLLARILDMIRLVWTLDNLSEG